jgi:hypothetical protein
VLGAARFDEKKAMPAIEPPAMKPESPSARAIVEPRVNNPPM